MPSDQHNRAYAGTDVCIAYSVVTIRFVLPGYPHSSAGAYEHPHWLKSLPLFLYITIVVYILDHLLVLTINIWKSSPSHTMIVYITIYVATVYLQRKYFRPELGDIMHASTVVVVLLYCIW